MIRNFPIIIGIIFIVIGFIMMIYLFVGNYDGVEPQENISLLHSNTVSPNSISFNFDTTTDLEQLSIHYTITRNASQPGFIALVIPYEGGFNVAFTGLKFHQFPSTKSLVFFKKFTSANDTRNFVDSEDIQLNLNGKIESYKFLSHHVIIPFSNTPSSPEILKFVNNLKPNGTVTLSGWNNIYPPASAKIKVWKNNDDVFTQPPAATFYDTDTQGKAAYRSVLWKITGDNPLYLFDYTTSDNRFYLEFFQTLGALFLGSGISMIVLGIETKHNDTRQKRLEDFIKIQESLQEAHTSFATKDYQEAKNSYDRAIKLNPKDTDPILLAGNSFFRMNRYEDAIPYYEKVLKIDDKHVGALNNIGVCIDRLGKPDEAINYYEKALDVNPDHIDTIINMGAVILDLGFPEIAVQYFDEVLSINEKDTLGLMDKGKALALLNRPDEAIVYLDKALKIDPKYTDVLNVKGSILFNIKDYPNAILCYERILKIDPSNSTSIYNLGTSYFELEDYDNAVKYTREFLITNSHHIDALNNLGVSLAKQGKHPEALQCYELILAINPDHSDALYNKGLSLLLQRHFDLALPCFTRAFELDPTNINAKINIGNCFLNQGNISEAIREYQEALIIDPNNAEATKLLSVALSRQQNP